MMSGAVMADNEGWKGEGELGYVTSTGNTRTETIAGKVGMSYKSAPWESEATWSTLQAKDDKGAQVANRSQLSAQTNYTITDGSYWFGAVRYEEDKFSGFDHQVTGSTGYGYRFWESDTSKLATELGLGMRESKSSETGEVTKETVTRAKLTHFWQFLTSTKWTNDLLVEAGTENTYIEFTTGVQVDISARFKLKVAHNIRRNSDVPLDRTNTDTITTVNLLFSF